MAKITIDTKGLIASAEDAQRAFQVATRAYALLNDKGKAIGHPFPTFLEMVEIIKVTTWTEEMVISHKPLKMGPVSCAEFQIVYTLPFSPSPSKDEKLKVIAEWNSRDQQVEVREDEPRTGKYIGSITLVDTEIETLAKALIRAIQMGFQNYRSRAEKLIDRLTRAEETMESLIKTPVKT